MKRNSLESTPFPYFFRNLVMVLILLTLLAGLLSACSKETTITGSDFTSPGSNTTNHSSVTDPTRSLSGVTSSVTASTGMDAAIIAKRAAAAIAAAEKAAADKVAHAQASADNSAAESAAAAKADADKAAAEKAAAEKAAAERATSERAEAEIAALLGSFAWHNDIFGITLGSPEIYVQSNKGGLINGAVSLPGQAISARDFESTEITVDVFIKGAKVGFLVGTLENVIARKSMPMRVHGLFTTRDNSLMEFKISQILGFDKEGQSDYLYLSP